MKRSFTTYMDLNIPDYIIVIADAIKDNRSISILLPQYIGDDIENVEYIINYLNNIMENDLQEVNIIHGDINFTFKYNINKFQIDLKYNVEKEIFKITCKTIPPLF